MQQLQGTTKKRARRTLETRNFRSVIRKLEAGLDSGNRYSSSACCGITLAQCHLLLEIEANEGSSLKFLATKTGLDKSTLSRTVDALLNSGYITRNGSESDRRKINIILSEKGREKADEINSICDDFYSSVLLQVRQSLDGDVLGVLEVIAEILLKTAREKKGKCRKQQA